jgi:TolB-like protein
MDRTAIIPPKEARAELERVLASSPFAHSPRSQKFLRHVVEASLNHADDSLKEFAIAVDVFDRDATYDPSIDATVRVEAGRLRTRLREYYTEAGRNDPIIIEVPKGGYRATFTERSAGPAGAVPHMDSAPGAENPQEPESRSMAPPAHSAASPIRPWVLPVLLSVVAAAILATTLGPHPLVRRLIRGNTQPTITSLAVIPLDNLSGDPGQEYFADGMTDEFITMLAKNSSLRIVSRTSVMQYKSARRPLPQIAHELGVDGILEGSVSRSGNRVHMNVQLIQAQTDTHLWAESYDRDANEAYELPHEVAEAVAKRLNSSVASASPPHYVNPQAHDAYLHGRYLWYAGQNQKALEYFKKATQLQPDYGPGWSGISIYYGAGLIVGDLDPASSLAPQQEAALKAVKLDDSFPEAHLSLCAAILINEWDFNRADQECLRATELDPEFAEAIHFRAKLLGAFNRNDEAIEAQRKATELDPVARPFAMAMAYQVARRDDDAIADVRQRLESYPENVSLTWHLHNSYRRKGMNKEAAQALIRVFQLIHDSASADAVQLAFQQGGYQAVVRWQLSGLQKKAQTRYVSPVDFARLYAQLGEREETLAQLEAGYRIRAPQILWIQSEPAFDFLHSDERYRSLIKRIGLPPAY